MTFCVTLTGHARIINICKVYPIIQRTGLAKFVNEIYKLKRNRIEYNFSRMAILDFFLIYNKHHKNDGNSVNEIG
ncbi:hypothetical protein MTsDn5_13100 [Alteromonas gracilis]